MTGALEESERMCSVIRGNVHIPRNVLQAMQEKGLDVAMQNLALVYEDIVWARMYHDYIYISGHQADGCHYWRDAQLMCQIESDPRKWTLEMYRGLDGHVQTGHGDHVGSSVHVSENYRTARSLILRGVVIGEDPDLNFICDHHVLTAGKPAVKTKLPTVTDFIGDDSDMKLLVATKAANCARKFFIMKKLEVEGEMTEMFDDLQQDRMILCDGILHEAFTTEMEAAYDDLGALKGYHDFIRESYEYCDPDDACFEDDILKQAVWLHLIQPDSKLWQQEDVKVLNDRDITHKFPVYKFYKMQSERFRNETIGHDPSDPLCTRTRLCELLYLQINATKEDAACNFAASVFVP